MSGHAAVPTEIFSEIFQQSLPHTLDQDGRLAFQIIRSVCSRWRSISLSTPVLWSSISVTCNISDKGFHDGYLIDINLLDAWFSRAGESIHLELDYLDPMLSLMRDEEKVAMQNLVRRHQARWRRLSLFIEPECFWYVFFVHPPSAWISLHTLSLYAYDFVQVGADRATRGLDALEGMPSLQRLVLEDNDAYEFERQYGPIHLPELDITLHAFGFDQARLITAYSRLTKLVLVAPPRFDPELSLDHHITLPFLLSFSYETHDLSLLDRFSTPSLNELDIQLSCDLKLHEDMVLSSFLLRCTSALRAFNLDSHLHWAFTARILPSLSERQGLTRITFDIWPFPNSRSRFQKDIYPCWCPHLRELTISIRSREVAESQRIADLATFLKHREELGLLPLESLTVRRSSGAAEFPYELFQDVRVGRLRVMIPV
ncbi:hypothetical protein BKA70DRAFT_1334773 [Coprinopsis sp. MPI-PUGE-AT-0042]|nr:hypothetical protein BKA70DRAFT_1334773 [Coprinopsis sp. MPI-PUGE-AT-0042]